MKRKISLLTIIFLLLLSVSSSAHPGRTDQNGGHWDRETGEYHFHTGEYAGRSSSGSTSTATYEPFTPPYEPPTDNPFKQIDSKYNTSEDTKDLSDIVFSVFGIVSVFILAIPIISGIIEFIYYCLEKCLSRFKVNLLSKKIDKFHLKKRKKYFIYETKVGKNKDNVSNNAQAYIVHFYCLCSSCGENINAKYRLKQNSGSTPKVSVNCPQCQARTTVQIRLPFDYTYNVEKTTK